MDSRALTKVQSAVLIAVVLVAAVGGGAAYVLWSKPVQSAENIRIGICGDLDMTGGKQTWQGAVLAAEQINAEGGIQGRNVTIVAEDGDDETTNDIAVVSNALTRLITVDKADYILTSVMGVGPSFAFQDVCAEHKKIVFSVRNGFDNLTLRVLDDYERYKYYFRVGGLNATAMAAIVLDYVLNVGNYTGLTKVATLWQEAPSSLTIVRVLNKSLPEHGLNVVYMGYLPVTVTDFTSYFAAIEESGAEILVPGIIGGAAFTFVKEWYERQSPVVVCGLLGMAQESSFWNLTQGKCEAVSFQGYPVIAGYPLTNKTLPTREAYIERWGEVITGSAVAAYDIVRFILPDAIKRAGTTETEAVIKALETIDVEISLARHFRFTPSHDVMIPALGPNGLNEDFVELCLFQWQNGNQVIVHPDNMREEAGTTYKYPPWSGPWNNKQTA